MFSCYIWDILMCSICDFGNMCNNFRYTCLHTLTRTISYAGYQIPWCLNNGASSIKRQAPVD